MIFDEETGGAARKPFEEIHAPVMPIGPGPVAASAFVVTEELLGAVGDWDLLPVRGLGRPADRPRGKLGCPRFLDPVPNLGAGFREEGENKKRDEDQTRDAKDLV